MANGQGRVPKPAGRVVQPDVLSPREQKSMDKMVAKARLRRKKKKRITDRRRTLSGRPQSSVQNTIRRGIDWMIPDNVPLLRRIINDGPNQEKGVRSAPKTRNFQQGGRGGR